jgi:predicted  nucleic acid-binding Zn-ribbon protein
MGGMSDEDALRQELEDLDDEIAELRRTVADARQRIGQEWDAPADEVDVATALSRVEEQEAFLRVLEDRRERLRARLGVS